MRRLVPFLVLLALLGAPYGRAQAQPATHDGPAMAMAGHCDPAPSDAPPPAHHRSIDCMIACAGMAVLEANLVAPPLPPLATMVAGPIVALHGILLPFDPPPPRSRS